MLHITDVSSHYLDVAVIPNRWYLTNIRRA